MCFSLAFSVFNKMRKGRGETGRENRREEERKRVWMKNWESAEEKKKDKRKKTKERKRKKKERRQAKQAAGAESEQVSFSFSSVF